MVDEIDSKIILELQKDGRQTFLHLARETGLSVATIARRVRLLTQTAVTIKVILDPYQLNEYINAMIIIKANLKGIDSICQYLSKDQNVVGVETVFGRYDIQAKVQFKTIVELGGFMSQLATLKDVKSLQHYIIIDIRKTYNSVLPKNVASKTIKLNDFDRELVSVLEQDGRKNFKDLARQLKVSGSTVARRLTALLESGTVKITAVPKPQRGEFQDAFILINSDYSKLDEICSELVKIQNVFLVQTCLGYFNIVIGIQSTSQKELYQFLKNKLSQMPGVRTTETMFVGEFIKF